MRLAVGSMDKLRRVPGWRHVFRAADALGAATPTGPVVFECVGVPGMIESVVSSAPLNARVVVVGVCMGGDSFRPSMAINKELDLRFVLCYTPLEFRDTLHALADGKVDAGALVTGTVGLDGVAAAFTALGDPERHAKILVDPASSATAPI
jgi:threonine dehydrogenase-like Zn-dependent dehydrogenase